MRRVIGWSGVVVGIVFTGVVLVVLCQAGVRADENPGSSFTILPLVGVLLGGWVAILVAILIALKLTRGSKRGK